MRPIGEAVTEATLPRDPWSVAMQAMQGDPEANRKAALAITGALSAPAKGIWGLLKADAEYAKANRDAARAESGLNTVGGNPGGLDMVSGMGLPLVAKALRAGDKAADVTTGIRAYHGSPHDFDKFDMTKIGTGEGAQAYGHGLYFAEKEGVAKSYRDALSTKIIGGKQADWKSPQDIAAGWTKIHGGDRAKALDYLENGIPKQYQTAETAAAAKLLRDGAELPAVSPGRMYEVNIAARPEQFLDWDKYITPAQRAVALDLSKKGNNPGVREYLREVGEGNYPTKGRDLYEAIANAPTNPSRGVAHMPDYASDALKDAGIPGIRYLDQGSRPNPDTIRRLEDQIKFFQKNAPKDKNDSWYVKQMADYKTQLDQARGINPTSNYVLFRDDIIDILRKYGIPGAGVAGAGAFAGGAPDATAEALRKKP